MATAPATKHARGSQRDCGFLWKHKHAAGKTAHLAKIKGYKNR